MIKAVLRQLKPMIVTNEVGAKILELGKEKLLSAEEAWDILKGLPQEHYQTLMYILTMIQHISRVEVNLMSTNALIRVFMINFMDLQFDVLVLCNV